MEFALYLIYYVSFAMMSFVSLEIPSLRTSESDLFTTMNDPFICFLVWDYLCSCVLCNSLPPVVPFRICIFINVYANTKNSVVGKLNLLEFYT